MKHGYVDAENQVAFRSPETGAVPREIEETLARADALIGEARARTARVALLFGPVSGPDRNARVTLIHLDGTLMALDAPVPELEKFSEELAGARKPLAKFNTSALREIQGRPWWARWRWVLWLRRHARRLRRRLPGRKHEASE